MLKLYSVTRYNTAGGGARTGDRCQRRGSAVSMATSVYPFVYIVKRVVEVFEEDIQRK